MRDAICDIASSCINLVSQERIDCENAEKSGSRKMLGNLKKMDVCLARRIQSGRSGSRNYPSNWCHPSFSMGKKSDVNPKSTVSNLNLLTESLLKPFKVI